jgi:hypothetical protein
MKFGVRQLFDAIIMSDKSRIRKAPRSRRTPKFLDALSISKRAVSLLEVIISFAIIALCILPLIYPHIFILKSERKFIAAVELDHLASRLYADRLQKLYQNDIPWQQIESGQAMPIDASMLHDAGYIETLPYTGTYRFVKVLQKPKKPVDKSAYLFQLEFIFIERPELFQEKDLKENNPKIVYKYSVPLERIEG